MTGAYDGVGGVFSAAHRDQDNGALHGHSWEVTAWFDAGSDALIRQARLHRLLATIDHTTLPDELSWGADIARWVAEKFADPALAQVDVARPLERIYARWVR